MDTIRTKVLTGFLILGLIGGMLWLTPVGLAQGLTAPEIISPTWINSEPLKMEDLRGKVSWWNFGPLGVGTAGISNRM